MNKVAFDGKKTSFKKLLISTVEKLLDIAEIDGVQIDMHVILAMKVEGNDVSAAIFFPDGTETTRDLKHFKLGIGTDHDFISLITSIAHEIVHVDQYVSQRLVKCKRENFDNTSETESDEEICFWEGEEVETGPYFELPWEDEAYRLQDHFAQLLAQDAAWVNFVKKTAKKMK